MEFALGGLAEEDYGFAKLKIVLYVQVLLSVHLHHALVEAIIVVFAHTQGKPCVAALHLALHSHDLRLFAESLFLSVIFHLQQQFLPLEGLLGILVDCHCSFTLILGR